MHKISDRAFTIIMGAIIALSFEGCLIHWLITG